MKKKIFILTAMVALCVNGFGQEAEPLSRTLFKLSPQHFTNNSLKAGVERFNQDHSASMALFVTGMMSRNEDATFYNSYDGVAGELQLRKYISPMKSHISKFNRPYHQGIYGAVYLQAGTYTGEFKEETSYYDQNTGSIVRELLYQYREDIRNWGGGFTIGYQKTLWQVVFLEAFVGGGLQFANTTLTGMVPQYPPTDHGITEPSYKGILPKIGLNIGIGL